MKKKMAKWMTWYMVVAMCVLGVTPRVDAGFSASELYNPSGEARQSDLQQLQKFLESKMVMEKMQAWGFTPEEIQVKLNQLDDRQIHQLARQIDELKVGGDGAGIVITLLVIAILIVILVYLLGHKIVIK